MKKITYSAPAKVILSGEHAVVYGKPGLVAAVDLRLRFSVWENKKPATDKFIIHVAAIVKKYLEKERIGFSAKNFDFAIASKIPIGQGLGSSAALSVASSAGLLEFYSGRRFAKETVNNIAYQAEKYFYKNPSGVDVSAACFGGLIFYRKEFEFLKNISSLNFKIPKSIEDNLYLVDSGRAVESTADMVLGVGKLYNKKPVLIEAVMNDVERTTKRMTVALVKEDREFFKKCLVDNQIYLEMLGVVSPKTKKLLERLAEFGVGKVTGGGGKKEGSGFILFYCEKERGLKGFLQEKRLTYYKFKQDYRGLIYEN